MREKILKIGLQVLPCLVGFLGGCPHNMLQNMVHEIQLAPSHFYSKNMSSSKSRNVPIQDTSASAFVQRSLNRDIKNYPPLDLDMNVRSFAPLDRIPVKLNVIYIYPVHFK